MNTKICRVCDVEKDECEFKRSAKNGYENKCKGCDKASTKARWSSMTPGQKARNKAHLYAWRKNNPEARKRIHRACFLKRTYGITIDDYERMLSDQGGCCAICHRPETGCAAKKYFSVDHCHETGKVRGLLCSMCNLAIGYLNDHPGVIRRAAEYIERH